MTTLVIDTATPIALIGAIEGDKVVFETTIPKEFRNSSFLFPKLVEECHKHNITPQQFTQIALGVGPGSYTGVRVGVAAAQGISFARNLPILPFCSLSSYLPTKKYPTFWVTLDARIGGIYLLEGRYAESGEIVWASSPLLLSLEELKVKTLPHCILSPELGKVQTRFTQATILFKGVWEEATPSLSPLCTLLPQLSPTQQVDILYLRKTEAEQKQNKKR